MRRKGSGRQCEEILPNGQQCTAWSLRDSDPPRCRIHSMSAEEVHAAARRAGLAGGKQRRGDTEAAARATIDPGLTFRDVAAVVRECLTAKLETGLPDRSAQLAACAVLLLAFPRYTRPTVDEAQRLLAQILPDEVYDEDRMQVEEAFRALRAEWWSLPAWHPVRGLVARELPRDLVPPWQDYATVVRRERPEDVPLEEAPVHRLPDGRVALQRPGEPFPVVLEEVEDGGLIRV